MMVSDLADFDQPIYSGAIQEAVTARRGKPANCVGAAHWMDTAILAGAQGIAGIGQFWPKP